MLQVSLRMVQEVCGEQKISNSQSGLAFLSLVSERASETQPTPTQHGASRIIENVHSLVHSENEYRIKHEHFTGSKCFYKITTTTAAITITTTTAATTIAAAVTITTATTTTTATITATTSAATTTTTTTTTTTSKMCTNGSHLKK